jgi:putative (di)nucleoside polyphosphate hydrolase
MEKLYRPNVAILITDGAGRVLICERIDGVFSAQVQTVQGGVDHGETAREAAVREVREEVGLKPEQFTIIAEQAEKFRYEWPEDYKARFPPGIVDEFVGQEQMFFLAQVEPDVEFNLETHHPEFSRVWWGSPQDLVDQCWEVKRPGIAKALRDFGLLK